MADLADKSDNHSAWAKFAPQCMSDEEWEVAAATREAILSHRSCPWGGHLIKLESKRIFVQQAPEDPGDVLVRPEVRAMAECADPLENQLKCLETFAPGDALLERRELDARSTARIASVLFGHCQASFVDSYNLKLPLLWTHRLYKDFPALGDATFSYEGMLTTQRSPDSRSHYRTVLVFRTPEDQWPSWASQSFPAITSMFHQAIDRFLNGPTIRDQRALDAKMYQVLSIQNYSRGPPMIPLSASSKDSFWILAGEPLGLMFWAGFKPDYKFSLSEYLPCFMKALGYPLQTWAVMDGRKLVPFQCVVLRHQWDRLRSLFGQAFGVQKTAYRHAHGGCRAPNLVEDLSPRWASQDFSADEKVPAGPVAIKTVVRNTFLELDEDSSDINDSLKRSNSAREVSTYFV